MNDLTRVNVEVPFLEGSQIYLRCLHPSDATGPYHTWFNDEEACSGNSHHVFPYLAESALEYIEYARKTQDSLILAIILRDGLRHIGNIALNHIDHVSRSAELAIIVGDRSVWGLGYGTEAATLLCNHGFQTLNLNRIYCGTFEDNTAMRRLACHLGMREEGTRRQAAFKRGRYVDVVEYGVLKDEFKAIYESSFGISKSPGVAGSFQDGAKT